MLILDSLRGEHSTGVAVVPRAGGHVKMAKQVGNPFELFDTKAFNSAMAGTQKVMIGHNRYATQGAINKRNAHPFEFETLVGAHNGTLTNKWQFPDARDFEVDSEALYNSIEVDGVDKSIKLAKGAWALTWWDKQEETLNFLRNDERTLFFTMTKDEKQIFWASEAWMLYAALGRHGIEYKEVMPFKEDLLHTIPVGNQGLLGKPTIRPVKSDPVIVYNRGQVVGGGASGSTFQSEGEKGTQTSAATGTVANEQAATTSTTNVEKGGAALPSEPFLRAAGELFEAVSICTDQYGESYIACFAAGFPFLEARLYVHPIHEVDKHLGCEFYGDISGATAIGNGSGKWWYRIAPKSVEIVSPGSSDDGEETFPTHSGHQVGRTEWLKEYGMCCCCSDEVNPEDVVAKKALLTTMGDSLCVGCTADPSLVCYITKANI